MGLVWGRRRVGKSFLSREIVERSGGFLFQAVRGASAESLRELGGAIAAFQGAPAPLALQDWNVAMEALLALGEARETAVVVDEFPYLLEHTLELDSILQRALARRAPERPASRARLILCGSALSIMGRLLSGSVPLRGRAGLDLRVLPFDLRTARSCTGSRT